MRKLFLMMYFLLFASNAFALPVNNHPELWVIGKIQNQAYLNWSFDFKLTAYNSTAAPTAIVAFEKSNGDFRIATQANVQQQFDLNYITMLATNPSGGKMYTFDQPVCRFTLQVDAKNVATLSVKTLEDSFVQCGVSQDTKGMWIITLTNPAGIS